MGTLRPIIIIFFAILLVLLGAYILGADLRLLGQIFLSTLVFLALAALAFVILTRIEQRVTQQKAAETRLLYFFRRWLTKR